jgi:hypothetical protein
LIGKKKALVVLALEIVGVVAIAVRDWFRRESCRVG